jgi:hypothetical protein
LDKIDGTLILRVLRRKMVMVAIFEVEIEVGSIRSGSVLAGSGAMARHVLELKNFAIKEVGLTDVSEFDERSGLGDTRLN